MTERLRAQKGLKSSTMRIGKIFKDESAVEGLPMRVVITIILFSVILGLSAKVVYNFINDTKEKKLLGELDLIEKRAAVMYMQGGARDINNLNDFSGTVETITVKIPDNVAFVVFGSMPTSDGKPLETRDTNAEYANNVYYYVLNDGRVQTKSSIAQFTAKSRNLNKPVVLYPGEYVLTLELVKNDNGMYVQID